jgi:hypothetical protein
VVGTAGSGGAAEAAAASSGGSVVPESAGGVAFLLFINELIERLVMGLLGLSYYTLSHK